MIEVAQVVTVAVLVGLLIGGVILVIWFFTEWIPEWRLRQTLPVQMRKLPADELARLFSVKELRAVHDEHSTWDSIPKTLTDAILIARRTKALNEADDE